MNKRGQVIFVTLMLGIIIIILAMSLASPISQFIVSARNNTDGEQVGLGCDNATRMANETTGMFDQGTCVIVDLFLPYFIGFLVALAGVVIGAKILLGGGESGE